MASQDSKRYFWFKCDHEFFNSTKMQRLKKTKCFDLDSLSDEEKTMVSRLAMECVYIKLLAESCTHGGELLYSDGSPYDDEGLSEVLEAPESFLQATKERLVKLELLHQEDDGTILMPELASILDSATGATLRMRSARATDTSDDDSSASSGTSSDISVRTCSRPRTSANKSGDTCSRMFPTANKREQVNAKSARLVPRDQRSDIRDQRSEVVLPPKGVRGKKNVTPQVPSDVPSMSEISDYLENELGLVAYDHEKMADVYSNLISNGWKDNSGKRVRDWKRFFHVTANSMIDVAANSMD